jgi:nitrite reductase/ring-hydroxylating ferredoxin subunit
VLAEVWHAIAPLGDIPEGLPHEVDVAGEPVLLVRHGETVHACAPLCPHKFGRLADGRLDGERLTCPMHTATFELSTGRPLAGQEWAGHLPVYPTRVREGVLEVHLAAP